MEEAAARARLESMVAAASVPTLDEAEITELLALARRSDTDGFLPDDDGWTGTYDLNAAAAEGWRWKAGKVAGKFSFGTDGQNFNRADMIRACQDMATTYRNRITGRVPYNLGTSDSDTVANV